MEARPTLLLVNLNLQLCHPERSKPIRIANRFAKSKDPYKLHCTTKLGFLEVK
jgi:hypothetical protein